MAEDDLDWVTEAVNTHRLRTAERDQRQKARQEFYRRAVALWDEIARSISRVVGAYNEQFRRGVLQTEEPPGNSLIIRWADHPDTVFCRVDMQTPPPERHPVIHRLSRWLDEHGQPQEDRAILELTSHAGSRGIAVAKVGDDPNRIAKALLKPWFDLL